MIHSGQPVNDFIDSATRHVLLRQGVLGIKVKIMRGSDPEGKAGPQKSLPDSVTMLAGPRRFASRLLSDASSKIPLVRSGVCGYC